LAIKPPRGKIRSFVRRKGGGAFHAQQIIVTISGSTWAFNPEP
jgi:hypothetical protein